MEKHEELNLFFPSSFSIILPDPDHVSVEAKGLEVLNYTSKQKDTKKMFTQEEWPVSDAVVTAARHMSGTLTLLTLHQTLCSQPLTCVSSFAFHRHPIWFCFHVRSVNEECGVQHVTDPGFERSLSAPGSVSPRRYHSVYFLKFQKTPLL